MQTEITTCDFCKRRIMPGQYLFKLNLGSALDKWEDGTQRDSCVPCLADEGTGLLATSDFNVIMGLRVGPAPTENKRTELPDRRRY